MAIARAVTNPALELNAEGKTYRTGFATGY